MRKLVCCSHATKIVNKVDFILWFKTGIQHITDWNGYDHILFLLALSASYLFSDWKKIILLVTAFTIGHCITLALSTFDVLSFKSAYVEFLVGLTILVSCVINFVDLKNIHRFNFKPNYWLALLFGFIHGLGFSYLLKSLLGKEENILMPLLAFNLGIEVGQLAIIITVLLFGAFLTRILRVSNYNKSFFISSAVFGVAFIMSIERFVTLINE